MENEDFNTISYPLNDKVQLEMVEIPAYKDWVDVPEEKAAEIRRDFMMGKYPVTQEQYEAVMGENPSQFKGAKRPVENVSWEEAQAFCERLNELGICDAGERFCLPTHFQMEYVMQSRGTLPFEEEAFGEYAWYVKNANGETHDVGLKAPNSFGLYDFHGNVQEWCDGEWEKAGMPGYPKPPMGNAMRFALGGSWQSEAHACITGGVVSGMPGTRTDTIGFRVALRPCGDFVVADDDANQDEAIRKSAERTDRLLRECPVEEDYENLREEVFDPAEENMTQVYQRYMYSEDTHAVILDNTSTVNVYTPLKVTVKNNHGMVYVYGNNVHAKIMRNDGYVRICSNNAKVTVRGNGTVDVMGHGNDVTVRQGIVHIYGENAVVQVHDGVVDVHSKCSKVLVHHGKATVMDEMCQELHCEESGELILPDNTSLDR